MTEYTVTIRRTDTVSDRCNPVPRPDTPCQGRAAWWVVGGSDDDSALDTRIGEIKNGG
jgi:hypothetical protein